MLDDVKTLSDYAVDAEQALIGAALADNRCIGFAEISADDFYDSVHGDLWRHMGDRFSKKQRFDAITLAPLSESITGLAALGGQEYLIELSAAACRPSEVGMYASMVKDISRRRAFADVMALLSRKAEDVSEDFPGLQASAEQAVLDLGSVEDTGSTKRMTEVIDESIARYEAARDTDRSIGVYSGLQSLDAITGPLRPGQQMVIAARPSMGKSTVLQQYAMSAARQGYAVYWFSLEMPSVDLGDRMIGASHQLVYSELSRGRLDGADRRFDDARLDDLRQLDITIDDSSCRFDRLASRVRRWMVGINRPGVVLIDHAGLVDSDGDSYSAMNKTLAAIKSLAMSTKLAVISAAQLNRQVESRDNKRPMLSDLRDSGRFEENPHIVLTLYRDAYYASREPEYDDPAKESDRLARSSCNSLEIGVLKNRNGRVGSTTVSADMATSRVWDPKETICI